MSASLEPFVPRLAVDWLRETPDARWRGVEGSLAFVDISGFTALTERLARKGRVGSEEMSDILNATFADLLGVAYADGAGLVKWGGDALLLLYEGEGHAERAVRASLRMRDRLARIGRIGSGSARVTLRMSVGVHSGMFHFFLVGDPSVHRELIVAGPGATRTARMESAAEADEVVVSPECAALLPAEVLGEARGDGMLVTGEPTVVGDHVVPRPSSEGLDVAGLIPPRLREHLTAAQGANEHRRITVAFVKFEGTDALLDEEGPEALADALDACVRAAQEATERAGVTFFETDIDVDGGKIMLTAGAPVSRGGDEGRMLRAARRIVEAPGRLGVRVGVNRGPVFAGDFGPPFRRTFSVKGDAVNLAARLLGRACAGQVVATCEVLDSADARFEVEPLEPFMVKGKSEPVEAAVVGGRMGAAGDAALPLVGREAELTTLREVTDSARDGRGSLVVLSGEPGIGKSRIVAEVVGGWDGRTVMVRCDAYEAATPYWPFRGLVRTALALAPDATGDAVRESLGRLADDRAPDLLPWLPLVGVVADVDMGSTPEVDALAEEFRTERTHLAVSRLLEAALDGPTLLVIDDAHLADPASSALMRALVDEVAARPWAVLATRRDVDTGFIPIEGDRVLRPAPLDDSAAMQLVRLQLEGSALTASDAQSLVSRSGGNPLFLRGLVRAAREGASLDTLPDTVEALVTAQIDQLPPDQRTLLRVASVLGLGFGEDEVRQLGEGVGAPPEPDRLAALTFFVRPEGDGRYRFEHQLIRDTAYEGLPYRLRRELHGRAAAMIESGAADPTEVAEALSLHYVNAGQQEPAWHFSRIAGERAAAKLAYPEAERFLERAVAAGKRLRAVAPHERAAVQVALGEARRRIGRGEAALAAFRSARTLLRDDPLATASVLGREASVHQRLGHYSTSIRCAHRGLTLLEGRDDAAGHRQRSELAMLCSGARAYQGRHRDALEWARRAEADAVESGDPEVQAHAAAMIHMSLMMLGTPDRSMGELALRMYERAGDRLRQSEVLNNLAMEAWTLGRGEEALADFQRAHELAVEAGDAFQAACTLMNVGDVLMRLGRLQEAEGPLEESLLELRAVGADSLVATALRGQGLVLAQTGRGEEGLARLAAAREIQTRLGEDDQVAETDAAIALAHLEGGAAAVAVEVAGAAVERCERADADWLLPHTLRVCGAALADAGRRADAAETLRRARACAGDEDVELGFILAELSRVTDEPDQSADLRRRAGEAWRALGFVGSARYPLD